MPALHASEPPPLQELKKLRKPVKRVSVEHRKHLSRLERLAVWITDRVGTMGFFLLIFAWTTLWLAYNSLAPKDLRFDPYPAFVLWLFLSNMIQIFFSTSQPCSNLNCCANQTA